MIRARNMDAASRLVGISVLLIDEHPVVRDGCRNFLDRTPDIRVVAECGDLASALAYRGEFAPDVVVLDLGQPEAKRLEAIRNLRAVDPKARILVFGVHENEVPIVHAMEAGALGYLSKHCATSIIADGVREVARGKPFIAPEHMRDRVLQYLCSPEDPLHVLSARELQLFRLVAEGHSTDAIADLLGISPKTVGVHHANVMRKLGLQNDAQLVRLAFRCNVTSP